MVVLPSNGWTVDLPAFFIGKVGFPKLLFTDLASNDVFGIQVIGEISGYFYDEEAAHLQFPLKNGVYYVAHGGNSPSINYHQASPDQLYAMDIVRLNGFGTRAKGIAPADLKKYEIYGDKVYSPCTGNIIEKKDGLKQLPPFHMNEDTKDYRKKHPAGNHVIIRCQEVKVILAHMIPGSIEVAKGEKIHTGKEIGKAGNSGNTSEPHLHIHAEKNGEGVPITFDGRFLKRNSLMIPAPEHKKKIRLRIGAYRK